MSPPLPRQHAPLGAERQLYAASLNQLAKNLTCEWAADGIRTNSVAPWYTATPLANVVLKDEEFKRGVIEKTPIGRIATVDEIAGASPPPSLASHVRRWAPCAGV